MTLDEVIDCLSKHGVQIREQKPLTNGYGTQVELASGQKVCVYNSGKWVVQGKNPDPIKAMLQGAAPSTVVPVTRDVFVVYGHDTTARTQLENMLRRWDCNPILLDSLPSAGQTIIEKLEHYTRLPSFAVVLATPDDEGHRVGHSDEKTNRARQNVVLELGMLLARLGRSKVAILLKNPSQMEKPSDIAGLIYIPFNSNVDEAKVQLAQEMNNQGLRIDLGRL